MKHMRRIIAFLGLFALLLCLMNTSAFAQEASEAGRFPEGIIEVPQGTEVSIDDDAGIVTIINSPFNLAEGDTFIVFLQDLPIGYTSE